MIQFINNIIHGILSQLKNEKKSTFKLPFLYIKYLKHALNKEYHSYKIHGKHLVFFKNPQAFLHTIDEIFKEEIYKFKTENKNPYIIDCGAYIGTSILYFKLNYPDSKIIAFEPDTNNYNLILKNLSSWNFSDIILHNKAIWIDNDGINFNEIGGMAGRIDKELSKENDKSKVVSQRLSDLLYKKVDFLKIDIEGAEYEVIKDCEGSLSNVEKIFIEYHGNYDEMYKLNEILNILLNQKFCYYIKEAGVTYKWPFWEKKTIYDFDVQLNIFAFRKTSETN